MKTEKAIKNLEEYISKCEDIKTLIEAYKERAYFEYDSAEKTEVMKSWIELKEILHLMQERYTDMYLSHGEKIAYEDIKHYINDSIPKQAIRNKIETLTKWCDDFDLEPNGDFTIKTLKELLGE